MKSKLIIFCFFSILCFTGFSQEKRILLAPNADYNTAVPLITLDGKETGIKLPVMLNWDNKSDVIQVEIKNIKSEQALYLFSGLTTFKEIKKAKKKIKFSKEITKSSNPKNSVRSIHNDWLINTQIDDAVKARIINLQDPPGTFIKFKIINSNNASSSINIHIYMGKNSKKGAFIETIAELKLDIDLKGPCQDAELKNIITLLNKKIKEITTATTNLNEDKNELAELPLKSVRNLKPKPASKDKKISSIADEKYVKYSNCDILNEVISDYNSEIEAHENALNSYNQLLEDRKKEIPNTPVNNCQFLKTANEKLMNLYYRIEQSAPKNRPSFQAEYDTIKNATEVNENCKEYAAYKEWCRGIEKLIKK